MNECSSYKCSSSSEKESSLCAGYRWPAKIQPSWSQNDGRVYRMSHSCKSAFSSLLNLVVLPIIYLFYFTVPIPKPCKVEKCIGSNCCLIQKPASLLHKLARHFLITVCWLVDYPSHYCQSLGIMHASRLAVSRGLKPRSYNLGDHLRVIHL